MIYINFTKLKTSYSSLYEDGILNHRLDGVARIYVNSIKFFSGKGYCIDGKPGENYFFMKIYSWDPENKNSRLTHTVDVL